MTTTRRATPCRPARLVVVCAQLLGALVSANAGVAGAQDSARVPVVTLAEARRRAHSVDPRAVAARAQVQIAGAEQRAARHDLMTPRLLATTSYTRFSEPFFNFGTGGITANATAATFDANYSLLGGGKRAELRRSRASLASAEALEHAARFDAALAADVAYFGVLSDRDLSRVAYERLRRAEEQLGVARVRVVAGEAIATDSLQLLLEVNRSRLQVLRRDSALAVSQLRLGREIGLGGPADAAPVDTTLLPELPLSQDDAIAQMRASGPGIAAARAAERRADAFVSYEKDGYLPDINVGATTGAYDSQFFPNAFKRTQFQLTVSFPLWNGGQRELGIARARVQRSLTRSDRELLERAAAEQMTEAYQGFRTSRASIDLARVGVLVATEAYRVQRVRYREGATTILDLLQTQIALTEAEGELVRARYGARVSLARIEALLGRRIGNDGDDQTNR